MKVKTAWRPGTDMIDVWIYQETFQGKRQAVVVMGADTWEWREVEDATRPEPSLTLPGEVFQALMAEGSDILPPSAAQARHLEDAIKVRDRLLTLVEKDAPH